MIKCKRFERRLCITFERNLNFVLSAKFHTCDGLIVGLVRAAGVFGEGQSDQLAATMYGQRVKASKKH
jgi:hypothetical protein